MPHLLLGVGEILWDLLPAGRQLGGAVGNVCCHAHQMGADARLVSRVGDDPLGREAIARLAALGLPTDAVGVDPLAPTGTVEVALADGQPTYTIRPDVAWDRIGVEPHVAELAGRADAVCFGTLAQRSAASASAIRQIVGLTPATTLRVFDINLRPPFCDRRTVESSLSLANALKLNDDELPTVAAMFGLTGDPREQLAELARRFDLRHVAYTRGARGSLLLGDGVWSEQPGRPVAVVDAVGAGDAFTAAWVTGLLARWDLDRVHARAAAVAAFVCTQPGATPTLPADLIA